MRLRKLRAAKILTETRMQFFDQEDLWLYVTPEEETATMNYSVRDDSFVLIKNFLMRQRDVVVFRDAITIRFTGGEIELVLVGDPYIFYKNLFPLPLALEDSSVSIDVH